ncbi:MAG: murein hydrolase activator EnvC [Burkholderiales bacterium]
MVVLVACAAFAAEAAPGERDLTRLRARIERLTRQLEAKESEKREARDALRDSERAISQANRTLAALQAEGRTLRIEAARLGERRSALERELAERERGIERLLRARQGLGAPDVLRAALSGDDPAELSRRLLYVGYVSRASAAVLNDYRTDLERLGRLEGEARAKAARLRAVEEASRADRSRIVRERQARRRVLERSAAEIRRHRREIGVLRGDEARLSRLLEELGRVLGRVESVPDKTLQSEPFSRLRGKLRLPLKGELTGRFGAPRGASGLEAKGVFIRAPQGEPVKAVARGHVVYADWMRGFGNLMIVDHGESYLSIYANAESLLKEVGERVAAGETLATAGASGGQEETGLYFEMRHLGRAFDPLRWVTLK